MTTSYSTYASVSSLIVDIYEASLFTLRAQSVLPNTVTMFNDLSGMQLRKVTLYNSGNVRLVAEGEAVTPTAFNKTALATLTPARYADNYLLTDERIRTDSDNVRQDAADDLGMSFGEYVDTQIASNFTSLTGGTIGAGLGTVTMAQVFAARSKLIQAKFRGPFYCVLGAGQWFHLVNQGGTAISSSFTRAQAFQDALINNYFTIPSMGDTVFVISPVVPGNGGGTCTGALYAPRAVAYDEREAFFIEPQRNANRGAWELNANLRFASGVWRAAGGVQLVSTDVIPTSGI